MLGAYLTIQFVGAGISKQPTVAAAGRLILRESVNAGRLRGKRCSAPLLYPAKVENATPFHSAVSNSNWSPLTSEDTE